MCRFTDGPAMVGSFMSLPGKMSESMTNEFPIFTEACMIFPEGSSCRVISLAPNARLYQSRAAAALFTARYGVTLPGGGPGGRAAARFGLIDLADRFLFFFAGISGHPGEATNGAGVLSPCAVTCNASKTLARALGQAVRPLSAKP